MKKTLLILFALVTATVAAQAQVYIGGEVAFWHNDSEDATTFKMVPEVGYNFNEKIAAGAQLGYVHVGFDEIDCNGFLLAPYLRYSFYENKIVRLFFDAGIGFSSVKIEDESGVNGIELGLKPGIALKLNSNFSFVAKCGFLGYRDDYAIGLGSGTEDGYGFKMGTEDLSIGFHYEF